MYVDSGYSDRSKGFTLIELLIVIAIIAIVASVIFVALDPISRFRDARNAQRWQDVEAVGDAVRIYQIDNKGQVPPGVDENWKMLGTDALGCDIACGVTGEISDSYLHS
ncbi:MAG: prepilin-type N-terminal cleavage/methylation domain-containing protein, partial [Candidatus Magasanikbacteria bacterium]|nr:prepilin-type N-terminal cleavage/methylation domain-containing protein [Candidatus Magasanikbacteria bacterium]